MAYIKEPKGIDFIIQSEALTEKARKEITAFIQAYKAKASHKPTRASTGKPRRKNKEKAVVCLNE